MDRIKAERLRNAKNFLGEHSSSEAANICGCTMSLVPSNLDYFCFSFAEHSFENNQIPDRIDWLYLNPNASVKNDAFLDSISWGQKDGAVFIQDKSSRFIGLNLFLLRGIEGDIASYSIRWFDQGKNLTYNDPVLSMSEAVGITTEWIDGREINHYIDYCNDVFWNFRRHEDGVRVLGHTEAVLNPRLTNVAIYFIKFVTNLLGFSGIKKEAVWENKNG